MKRRRILIIVAIALFGMATIVRPHYVGSPGQLAAPISLFGSSLMRG